MTRPVALAGYNFFPSPPAVGTKMVVVGWGMLRECEHCHDWSDKLKVVRERPRQSGLGHM